VLTHPYHGGNFVFPSCAVNPCYN